MVLASHPEKRPRYCTALWPPANMAGAARTAAVGELPRVLDPDRGP